jgi:hypothetical protein
MKKRNLLAMAALSCFAFTANAAEYWVIKDGKLNENIVIMPNADDPVIDELKDGDATTGASFKHNEVAYKDVQLDLAKLPVSLKSTWVLEMEYKVPASALDAAGLSASLWSGKKPMFIFGMYADDAKTLEANNRKIDVTKADINIAIDGKFAAQADTWTIARKYVYANPSVDSCKILTLSYCREIEESLEPIYIKNLKFVDCNGASKSFYAEDFQAVGASRLAVYSDNTNFAKLKEHQLAGGKQVNSEDLISANRSWEDNGYDGSVFKFMDDENYHALQVPAAGADIRIDGIEIPELDPGMGGKISFKAFMKNKWADGSGFELATDEQRVIPAVVEFDNGATVNITDSLMDGQWDHIVSLIAVPAGAKTLSLVFKSNAEFAYLVDNIHLGVHEGGDNVADIESELAIEVSPNPATDIITVSGDVEKIEVIALNGAIVASAEGNQANIAALAAGSYIVKAYTAEGIAFKSIIKK